MHPVLQQFPWVRELPVNGQEEFADELAHTPQHLLPSLIAAWKMTAEVYANPERYASLLDPSGGNFGSVSSPEA